METKQCTKCKEVKELKTFKKVKTIKSGYASICKNCQNEYQRNRKEIDAKTKYNYYINNKEKIKLKSKEYYINNKEKIQKYNQDIYKNNDNKKNKNKQWQLNNKDKVKIIFNRYKEKNKDKLREKDRFSKLLPENKIKKNNYLKKKYNNDLNYKISKSVRSLIGGSFNRSLKNKYFKSQKTTDILCCSFKQLKDYFFLLFFPEMNWDNYGTIWEIDHIIPISSAKNEEDIIRLNHYTNLKPLFKTTEIAESFGYQNYIGNRNKGNRIL